MTQREVDPIDNCPGTGQRGHLDFSAPGDDWYVRCPVWWAGGSDIIAPHTDRRAR